MRSFCDLVKIFLFVDWVDFFVSLESLSFGFEKVLSVRFKMPKRGSITETFDGSIDCYFFLLNTLHVHYIVNV